MTKETSIPEESWRCAARYFAKQLPNGYDEAEKQYFADGLAWDFEEMAILLDHGEKILKIPDGAMDCLINRQKELLEKIVSEERASNIDIIEKFKGAEFIFTPDGTVEINIGFKVWTVNPVTKENALNLRHFLVNSDDKRVQEAPNVMIKGRTLVYVPIAEGETFITVRESMKGELIREEHVATEDVFLYVEDRNVPDDVWQDVCKNPNLLREQPELFRYTQFGTQDYFSVAAGEKVEMSDQNMVGTVPGVSSGYAVNDGHGHVCQYAGPYKLLKVKEGEHYTRNYRDKPTKPEDYIVYDVETKRDSIAHSRKDRKYPTEKRQTIYPYINGKIMENAPIIKGNREIEYRQLGR